MHLDEAQILLDQARIALKKGDFAEAHALVDRTLKEFPDLGEALNLKALIFFKEKRYAEAKKLFLNLYEKFPGEPALVLNLGISSLKLEQWQDALNYLHRALELQPDNPKIHNYLGLAYSGVGEFQKAKEEFLKGGSKKMADQMLSLLRSDSEEKSPAPVEVESEEVVLNLKEVEPAPAAPERPSEAPDSARDLEAAIDEAFTPAPAPLPEGSIPLGGSPQDLLAQALRTLGKRYEQFLETELPGKGLKELSDLLEIRKEWERPAGLVAPNLAALELNPQRFTVLRASTLILFSGEVALSPLYKRYKGKDLKAPFGSNEDPVCQCQGSGELFALAPERKRFFLLRIENELVYILEDAFAGMAGEFRWENGRLPSPRAPEPQIVQIRGEGHLLLYYPASAQVRILSLSGGKCTVQIPHLIGWFGSLVPVMSEWGKERKVPVVQFQGNGGVIVLFPQP